MHTGYIKTLMIAILAAIIIALALWVSGTYRPAKESYLRTMDVCLSTAAEEELNLRVSKDENPFKHTKYSSGDTSKYLRIRIVEEDTTIHLVADRDDHKLLSKIVQYNTLEFHPVDVLTLDSLFKRQMAESSLGMAGCYVEYLDLKKDTVLSSSPVTGAATEYNLSTGIDTLDILKSIGVRAHVKAPAFIILRPVMLLIATSTILILVALVCLILLFRDVMRLYKKGFRLLRFVAKKAEYSLAQAAGEVGEAAKVVRLKVPDDLQAGTLDRVHDGLVVKKGYFEKLGAILDVGEGRIEFTKKPFNIITLFEELRDEYERIAYKDVTVSIRAEGAVYLNSDRYYLKRILMEVLDNSVKYSGYSVEIHILTIRKSNKILVILCDHGGGMSGKELDDIYAVHQLVARAFNDQSVMRKNTKPGLGLSYVLSFTKALGGTAGVFSEDNMTGVKLSFPVSKEDMKIIAQARQSDGNYGKDFFS